MLTKPFRCDRSISVPISSTVLSKQTLEISKRRWYSCSGRRFLFQTPVALDPSSQQLQSLLSTINATRSAPAVMPPRADAHGSQSPPFANEGRSGAGYNQPPRAMSPPQQDNMSQKLPPAVLSLLEGTGGSAASQAPPLPAPPPVPQPPPLTSGSDVSSLLALLVSAASNALLCLVSLSSQVSIVGST